MIKRNHAKPEQKQTRRWPTLMLIFLCGLMLVSGFFLAGRQHFSSMDYGMKNSRLRNQIDDLQAEKRRLLLAREIALSPGEVKKAVRKVGFTDEPEIQPELAKAPALKAPTTTDKVVPASVAVVHVKPMIVKTAAVTAASSPVPAVYSKSDKIPTPVKRTTSAAE